MIDDLRWPQVLSRICGMLILTIMLMHLLFLVFPSYWSGIYRLSAGDIYRGTFSPPIYGRFAGGPYEPIGIIVFLAVKFLIAPLALTMLLAVGVGWRSFPPLERVLHLIALLATAAVVKLTWPAADALMTWMID